jgi:hypothetical protein
MLTKQFDDVLPTFSYARVPEAAMPKLTTQETHLLNQLADLDEARLTMGYGRLPSGTDAAMLAAIELVQKIGFSMRTADAIARPFPIPSRVAYEIIRALRGERVSGPADEGMAVPDRKPGDDTWLKCPDRSNWSIRGFAFARSRVERHIQCQSLLAGCSFGPLELAGDLGGRCLLPRERLEFADVLRSPVSPFRLLDHHALPGVL